MGPSLAELLRQKEFTRRANTAWTITQESGHETSFFIDKVRDHNAWVYTGVWIGSSTTSTKPWDELMELYEEIREVHSREELEAWRGALKRTDLKEWYMGFRTDRQLIPRVNGQKYAGMLRDWVIKDCIHVHTHPPLSNPPFPNPYSLGAFPSLSDLSYLDLLDEERVKNSSPYAGIGFLLAQESSSSNALSLVLFRRIRAIDLPTVEEYEESKAYKNRDLDLEYFNSIGFLVGKVNYPLCEGDISSLEKFAGE